MRRVGLGALAFLLLSLGLLLRPTASDGEPSGTAYAETISSLDERIAQLSKHAGTQPGSWLAREWVAQAYLERADLSGSYRDYQAAEAWLDQAFAIAGEAGPFTTRARLHYRLHRLAESAADVEEAEQQLLITDSHATALLGLRGDLAFQRGRYSEALAAYQAVVARQPDATSLFRLASFQAHTGNLPEAQRFLSEALLRARGSPQLTAFLQLHLGLLELERGRYREALAHYQLADAAFQGWWLIDEHLAEVFALQGHNEQAREAYRAVIANSDRPEYLDALALLALADNRLEEARALIAQAEALHLSQLEAFPEASYGHALDHFLLFERGAVVALELAEQNAALRPNGEAKMRLAQALLKAGQLPAAREVIEQALASEHDSAELHATAAFIFTALGDRAGAARERAAAEAINPYALANLAWLEEAPGFRERPSTSKPSLR